MVEMLGVLAVIGVLTVGGIVGYTSAMNKHRANEILNEASKQAVLVAGQLLTNPSATTLPLTQFGPSTVTGATFGANATVADGKITLTLSGVETAICNQMKTATGNNSVMTITGNCGDNLSLTFAADMSKGSSTPAVTCTPACDSTQECVDGNCIRKADPNNSRSCAKNSDCNTWCTNNKSANDYGCYCQISVSYTGTENACYNEFTGICQTIGNTEKTNKYSSSDDLTWWSAKNFCSAIGSHMVKTTDVCGSTANPFNEPSDCTSTPDFYWVQECWCNKDSDSNCTCNDNSCSAFYVDGDHVGNDTRRINYYALCV